MGITLFLANRAPRASVPAPGTPKKVKDPLDMTEDKVLTDKNTLTDTQMQSVKDELLNLFKQVDPAVSVQIVTTKPTMANTDLICYVVPDFEFSVIAVYMAQPVPHGATDQGITGFKISGTQGTAACEVYVASNLRNNGGSISAPWIARLIFHEFMHNKALQGDSMHKSDGLQSGTILEATPLTAGNIAFMKAKLTKVVTQWDGGFALPLT